MLKHFSEGAKRGELLGTWTMQGQVWSDVLNQNRHSLIRLDLDRALALEPTDKSVKDEILELDKISQQQEPKQRSKSIVSLVPQ